MTVIDASALLAFLYAEEGHAQVAERLSGSCISTVNLAEVLGRFARDGHNPRGVLRQIERTPIEFMPFLAEDAALAAALLPDTRPLSLSLADRACLALAAARKAPVLTADRTWSRLNIGISIELIR